MKKRKFGLLISSVVATGAILAACGAKTMQQQIRQITIQLVITMQQKKQR